MRQQEEAVQLHCSSVQPDHPALRLLVAVSTSNSTAVPEENKRHSYLVPLD
jgi:hypothetical protein